MNSNSRAGRAGQAEAAAAPAETPSFRQSWRKLGQVLPCTPDDGWDNNPASPHVIQVGDKLRMYYEGRQPYTLPNGRREYTLRIGMAEASIDDPLRWKKYPGNPTLDVGPEGSVDSRWAGYPWIVRVTETHWHMYYAVWDGSVLPHGTTFRRWGTAMAESDDAGITWRRRGGLLFKPGRPGACDEHGTGSCSVLQVGDEYWMWYTALYKPRPDFHRISIALAISRDGGHSFEPHPAGAVLNKPPVFGAVGSTCSKPHLEHRDGRFLMWFSCSAPAGRTYRINYAESTDGICFRWHPEPVLEVSPEGWDSKGVCYPSVIHLPGRTLMYYGGNGYNPSEQLDGIGVAELVGPSIPPIPGA
jgi:hypothetical protein